MPANKADDRWMKAALEEARRGSGFTSPNPAVGAVLVQGDKLLARGYHRRAGEAHAEVDCLRAWGRTVPSRARLYVTLEPCSTVGRTGACTDAIIKAGVKRLIVGATDPNPAHCGQGLEALRNAGVAVVAGVLKKECAALNEAWNKWIQTRRPFVYAKCGMSLDGRLTRPPGEPQWLTNAESRRHSHSLRARVDAILIGAGTLRADNPRLSVRTTPRAPQPWRVVLSRSEVLSKKSHIFTDRSAHRTLVYNSGSLSAALEQLGAREITSVLLEGGGDILGQALDARLIDKFYVYLAPMFTGGPVIAFAGDGVSSTDQAARLHNLTYLRFGEDICITGYPSYPAAERE